MDPVTLKIILLVVMIIVSLLFGLVPMKLIDYIEKRKSANSMSEKFASKILTILSCFSGGVFLGVSLLDLLPLANETFESVKSKYGWKSEYPFSELFIGIGLFLVNFIELISMKVCGHSHPGHMSVTDQCQTDHTETASIHDHSAIDQLDESHSRRKSSTVNTTSNVSKVVDVIPDTSSDYTTIKSLMLITAFTFHSCLEGFAFGVQKTAISIATLFLGIIVHKALVLFTIGMSLTRANPSRKFLIIGMIAFVSITAPVGAAIGIIIQNMHTDELSRDIVTAVITALANGTIIYITFFEILYAEHCKNSNKLLQWASTTIGFALISLLMIYDD